MSPTWSVEGSIRLGRSAATAAESLEAGGRSIRLWQLASASRTLRGMRMALRIVATILTLVFATPPAHAAEWRIEVSLGAAWNAPLPLVIRQDGEPELRIRPKWSSRSFQFPLYYAVGIERDRWSLSLVHHKLHLLAPPREVEEFAISHGYNLVMVGHRWRGAGSPRLAAGAVVAHPENRVRGRAGPQGYRLAGPVLEASVRREVGRGRWRLLGELAGTAAWAQVPVSEGDADVPNLALHARIGTGLGFSPPDSM